MTGSVCILCVIHKPSRLPGLDYLEPVQVGKAVSEWNSGYAADNEGINISQLNPVVSEITALYWFWKNGMYKKYDFVGLSHYRRFFLKKKNWFAKKGLFEMSMDEFEAQQKRFSFPAYVSALLEKYDIITAKPSRSVTVDKKEVSLKEQFAHYHHAEDWTLLGQVIKQRYPGQYSSFLEFEQLKRFSQLNMFIARSSFLDEYMNWLMPLLEILLEKLPVRTDPYQKRAAGFISERLFSFYIFNNKLKACWLPVAFIKDQA